jgi:hypothetical protein
VSSRKIKYFDIRSLGLDEVYAIKLSMGGLISYVRTGISLPEAYRNYRTYEIAFPNKVDLVICKMIEVENITNEINVPHPTK